MSKEEQEEQEENWDSEEDFDESDDDGFEEEEDMNDLEWEQNTRGYSPFYKTKLRTHDYDGIPFDD